MPIWKHYYFIIYGLNAIKNVLPLLAEKKMQEELILSESTVEGYIGKLKEYKSILSIKTLNPNNEEDKKEIDKALGVPYDGR